MWYLPDRDLSHSMGNVSKQLLITMVLRKNGQKGVVFDIWETKFDVIIYIYIYIYIHIYIYSVYKHIYIIMYKEIG